MKNLLIIAFVTLFIGSCATTRSAPKKPKINLLDDACQKSCEAMSYCSSMAGPKYSEHELLLCKTQCLETEPVLRQAVLACSFEVLSKSCDPSLMQSCVQSVYMHLKSQMR